MNSPISAAVVVTAKTAEDTTAVNTPLLFSPLISKILASINKRRQRANLSIYCTAPHEVTDEIKKGFKNTYKAKELIVP